MSDVQSVADYRPEGIRRSINLIEEDAVGNDIPLAFAAYWRSIRQGVALPHKNDFDPIISARAIVPFIVLYDVVDGGRDFRVRRMGEEVIDRYGGNLTGKTVRDYVGADSDRLVELYNEPLRRKDVIFYRGSYARIDRGFVTYEAAFAPLTSSDGNCDFLVGVIGYSDETTYPIG